MDSKNNTRPAQAPLNPAIRSLKPGANRAIEEASLNLLKEGTDPQFVARVTGLPLEQVMQLQAQVSKDLSPKGQASKE